MSLRRAAARVAPVASALLLLIALWDLGVRIFEPEPWLVPPPGDVVDAFWRTRSVLDDHLRATMTEAVLGLVIGSLAGAALAIGLSLSTPVRRAVQPLLIATQSVPLVVLAPLLIVWFGFGTGPRVAVVAIIAFFPVAISTLESLLGTDAEVIELFRGLGAGRRTTLWQARLPAALPGFFAGMKVSSAYAMFGAVVAEWMGASVGLGVYLQRSQASFRTDQLFAAVFLIAVASMALFGLVSLLARVALPWRHPEPGAPT
ncbi:MAG: ABC transporter permease [Actinomycetota bacterium]